MMESLDEFNWSDLIEYGSLLNDVAPPPDLHGCPCPNPCSSLNLEASLTGTPSFESESTEGECSRKRARGIGSKACRERLRREKLNERFVELSAVLEPGRRVKADKLALLGDAIKMLSQLKAESQELKESNERLLEEIKNLKAEKNELRQEKQSLKAEKEMMEQQMKTMAAPPAFIPSLSPVNKVPVMPSYKVPVMPSYKVPVMPSYKVPVMPSYGFVPVWQYLPSGTRDTSQDHELRPPAA